MITNLFELQLAVLQKKSPHAEALISGGYLDHTFKVNRLISVTLRSLSMLPRY